MPHSNGRTTRLVSRVARSRSFPADLSSRRGFRSLRHESEDLVYDRSADRSGWVKQTATSPRANTNPRGSAIRMGIEWLEGAESGGDPAAFGFPVRNGSAQRLGPLLLLCAGSRLPVEPRPADLYQPGEIGYPENDTVHALWFPTPKDKGRALVLLPQWNSDANGHVGLAKLLNRFASAPCA